MKRFCMLLAAFGFFSVAAVNAQSTETQQKPDSAMVQDNKKEIQFSDLPEAVQTGFQDSDYAEWETTKVYEVSADQGTSYEITVSDGTNEKTIMFDEDGNMKEGEE